MTLKQRYVGAVRLIRRAAESTGALDWLDRHRETRGLLYLRSLFSIYDAEDMARIDVPWWTFAAAAWVERFLADRPGSVALEYGSGASTVWLARRCARVHSIEHDPAWGDAVARLVAPYPNVSLTVVPPDPLPPGGSRHRSRKAGWRNLCFERYVRAIDAVPGCFDLVVIDGRCREACLEAALPRLAAGGAVVFDNTLRPRYRRALATCGLRARVFTGLAPGLPYPDQTTILGGPA